VVQCRRCLAISTEHADDTEEIKSLEIGHVETYPSTPSQTKIDSPTAQFARSLRAKCSVC
jgi:hypothetical protein